MHGPRTPYRAYVDSLQAANDDHISLFSLDDDNVREFPYFHHKLLGTTCNRFLKCFSPRNVLRDGDYSQMEMIVFVGKQTSPPIPFK